ncbi:hypothetical protein GOP47_0001051 [Adiantum capillus-veneris]|uniref:Protein kinase domain-containing protein n=1 Tax=Adiantum capillus-veneris TaxID=13818 RepID=A0A9D4VGB2_ADICA|nr:hypothetical protein GOP47_0001051 [Adiantum capillus-veneris]
MAQLVQSATPETIRIAGYRAPEVEDSCVSDYEMAQLVQSATPETIRIAGYRAPEVEDSWLKVPEKADVYSFGVILLELLTGQDPSQKEINLPHLVQLYLKEGTGCVFDMKLMGDQVTQQNGMLDIAIECVASYPDLRPSMKEVLDMMWRMCCKRPSNGR